MVSISALSRSDILSIIEELNTVKRSVQYVSDDASDKVEVIIEKLQKAADLPAATGSQHTPSPWVWGDIKEGSAGERPPENVAYLKDNPAVNDLSLYGNGEALSGPIILRLDAESPADFPSEADARLIAAAPVLLETLKHVASELLAKDLGGLSLVAQDVHAAIALAENPDVRSSVRGEVHQGTRASK